MSCFDLPFLVLAFSAKKAIIIFLIIDGMDCTLGLDDCDEQATCIDTIGSYTCNCNSGWTGDGLSCEGKFTLS